MADVIVVVAIVITIFTTIIILYHNHHHHHNHLNRHHDIIIVICVIVTLVGIGGGFRKEPFGPITVIITDWTHDSIMILGHRGKVRGPITVNGMIDDHIFIVAESVNNGVLVIGKEFEIMVSVIETKATGWDLTCRVVRWRRTNGKRDEELGDKRGKYVEHRGGRRVDDNGWERGWEIIMEI